MNLDTIVAIISLFTFPLFIGFILLVLNAILGKDPDKSIKEVKALVGVVYFIMIIVLIILIFNGINN